MSDPVSSGLRLGALQEQRLRAWPTERIRPKSVALGVRSLLAEVSALRSERDALAAENQAQRDQMRDVIDCLCRVLDGSSPFSLTQREEVRLAIEVLERSLLGAGGEG